MTRLEGGVGGLADYYEWFKQANSGDTLVYHTGDLAFERYQAEENENPDQRAQALVGLAKRVFKDAGDGYLILTQRRLGTSFYEYRATRVLTPGEAVMRESMTRVELA